MTWYDGPPGGPIGLRRLPQVLIDAPPSGSVPGSEYQYGTHAAALAAEEAAKTQVWRSARTAIGTALGAFITVAQQSYADTQPVVWPSVRAGQRPPVLPFVVGQPERTDLTQQAVVFHPSTGRQGNLGEFIYAEPERTDLTQQAAIFRPTPARRGPVLPPILATSPPFDLTQQALVWRSSRAPPAASGPVPAYVVGFGEETSYNTAYALEAVGGSPPILAAFYTVSPDVVASQQPSVWAPARTQVVVSTRIGSFVTAAQQQVEDRSQVFPPVVRGQRPPIIPFVVGEPERLDVTPQPRVWAPANSAVVVSTRLGAFVIGVQQQQEEVGTRTFPSVVRGQTPPIIPFVVGQPERLDLTPPSSVRGTAPMAQGKPPPFIVGGPPNDTSQPPPQPSVWSGAPPAAVAPPNLHRLVMDIDTGRLGLMVSGTHTGSPILVKFF